MDDDGCSRVGREEEEIRVAAQVLSRALFELVCAF
jgi:hypothetical protein